jgi:hypothetical protein
MAVQKGDIITPQSIVDYYKTFITTNTVNAGITWGKNSRPTESDSRGNVTEIAGDASFAGNTTGVVATITAAKIGAAGGKILANTVYNQLIAETQLYTNVRNLRARLYVQFTGASPWNTGTRPIGGYSYDLTRKSHLSTAYRVSLGTVASTGVTAGSQVSVTNINTFYNNLKTNLTNIQNQTVIIQRDVCHASCHSSCHGSRGRR